MDLKIKESFVPKYFMIGAAVVVLFYAALIVYAWSNKDSTYQSQQDRLPSQTVLIDLAKRVAIGAPAALPDQTGDYKNALRPAPLEGLYKETINGPIPIIRRDDNMTAFRAYRHPFNLNANNKPIISIGVMGLGLSNIATESAIRSLPSQVSFVYSPYSENLNFWVTESRARGHEVWMMLPLETQDYPFDDPGPHTILTQVTERENMRKLEWLMGRVHGYVGFVTNFNPVFMSSLDDMRPIAGNIFRRGLGLISTNYNSTIVIQKIALGLRAPYGIAEIHVDQEPTQEAIRAQLEKLEQMAVKDGKAMGLISPYPVSYQEVLTWLETLEAKGFALAPLSAQIVE